METIRFNLVNNKKNRHSQPTKNLDTRIIYLLAMPKND